MSFSSQRNNLLELLKIDLSEYIESGTQEHEGFAKLAAEWSGYSDLPDDQFIFSSDRGIDFYVASPQLFEIFQVKSHRLTPTGDIDPSPFDSEGVSDLSRAHRLMCEPSSASPTSPKVSFLLQNWLVALSNARDAQDDMGDKNKKDISIAVNLNLVIFGDRLTTEAQDEFNILSRTLEKSQKVEGVEVAFRPVLTTIDELLSHRWREDNLEWKDRNGSPRHHIDLAPDKVGNTCFISGEGNAVFYCKVADLVKAFEDFGYQIFEPNVRARIVKSKVNEAIEGSIASSS